MKNKKRPDYVHCIHYKDNISFCGRPLTRWYFTSVNHALSTISAKERLLPCPDCVSTVLGMCKKYLDNQDWL